MARSLGRYRREVTPDGVRIYTYRRFVGDVAVSYMFTTSGRSRGEAAARVRQFRRRVIDEQLQLRSFLNHKRAAGAQG